MSDASTRGARARTSRRPPAVSLTPLLEQLAKAIPAVDDGSGKNSTWPLFSHDAQRRRLQINTRGVLSRLWSNKAFPATFTPGDDSGFVHNVTMPSRGRDAKVGGVMADARVQDFPHAVGKLRQVLEDEMQTFLAKEGIDPAGLVCSDPMECLTDLAGDLGARFAAEPVRADMTPLTFAASDDRGSADRKADVARLIAGVEVVETKNWLSDFEKPARRRLRAQGLEDEEIDDAMEGVRAEAARPDSQASRFVNFLEDYALARIRLEVGCAIMESIRIAAARRTDEGSRLLVRFIDNVRDLRARFLETENVLSLDFSSRYGMHGAVNVSEAMRSALFHSCLSVWPEPEAQMFEIRSPTSGVTREISYRFRINGTTPKGESAFDARLEEIERALTQEKEVPEVVRRRLTELSFLSLVIPKFEHLQDPRGVTQYADALSAMVAREGGACVERLIANLKGKRDVIARIAPALVDIMRSHGTSIVSQAEKRVEELYVCVQDGVVLWDRLAAATDSSADFLIRPAEPSQDENQCWFRHVVIHKNPASVAGTLFSVRVTTRLRERILTRQGAEEPYALHMQRVFGEPLLQVAVLPYGRDPESGAWQPRLELPRWRGMPGVDIQVEEEAIANRGRVSKVSKETMQHQHAATTTAFAMLIHTVLWLLRKRIAQDAAIPRLLVLRGQNEGRNLNAVDRDTGLTKSGSEVGYALWQAVELALACDGPAFMQGVSFANKAAFRDTGAFAAFLSAFPLALACPQAAASPPVALINYTTRPCSWHPGFQSESAYLYTVKTYVAEAVTEPVAGHVLRAEGTRMHIQPEDAFREPALIFEEIRRLSEAGCKHILLLWQHYNNRHIGRTADRHAPHSAPDFLERVATHFPDVTVYPMCRDVFPAMRLRQDHGAAGAYEVLRGGGHEEFWLNEEEDARRELLPVYTFATMAVVGNEAQRPQSGFCTYFLEFDSRLNNREWAERARANLVDPNQNSAIRPVIVSVLRGLHFLHAEREAVKGRQRPKLDPHHWIAPTTIAGAGELKIFGSRHSGAIVLSFAAVLCHLSSVLRGARK
jgi:hypothetical protein